MSNHGRLANPEETFMTDRRADPRLAQALARDTCSSVCENTSSGVSKLFAAFRSS